MAATRAQGHPPDLSGRWFLNETESEQARGKFIWPDDPGAPVAARPARPVERDPAARDESPWRGGTPPGAERTRVNGAVPPAFRGFMDAARTLAITSTVVEVTIDEGPDARLKLPIDGSELKQGSLSRAARWEGSRLVVEARAEGGSKLITRYSLMPDGRKLEVYLRLSDRQGGAITLRRVYDAAPAAGPSPQAEGAVVAPPPVAVRTTSAAQAQDVPRFGVTTELVYVRFHVERKGGYLDRLGTDQIRVLEDGRPQRVAVLETPATRERSIAPEVTLALDVSSSVMDAGLLDQRLVKDVFLAGLSAETRVALCAFGGELRCFSPPTRDTQELLGSFEQAMLYGRSSRGQGTRLYASVADICKEPSAGVPSQRALVILSDGLDNQGGSVKEAIAAALGADVRVYAVKLSQAFRDPAPLLGPGGFSRPPNRALYDYKKLDLARLARETGGRAYEPAAVDKRVIAEVLQDIATEIAMEHIVGYQPQGPATGKTRRVKVELADKSIGRIPDGERTLVR